MEMTDVTDPAPVGEQAVGEVDKNQVALVEAKLWEITGLPVAHSHAVAIVSLFTPMLAAARAALDSERDAKLRLMGQIADMMGEAREKDAEIERLKGTLTTIARNGHKAHWSKTRIVNLASNEIFDWHPRPDPRDTLLASMAATLKASRGWVLNATAEQSAQAKRDLKKIDAALDAYDKLMGEQK